MYNFPGKMNIIRMKSAVARPFAVFFLVEKTFTCSTTKIANRLFQLNIQTPASKTDIFGRKKQLWDSTNVTVSNFELTKMCLHAIPPFKTCDIIKVIYLDRVITSWYSQTIKGTFRQAFWSCCVLVKLWSFVVYFDQCLGAAHSKRWSKYTTVFGA